MFRVYKFGGASIRNPSAIRQMGKIVGQVDPSEPLVIVVSAMGKTTNALESIHKYWTAGNQQEAKAESEKLITLHSEIKRKKI